MKNMAIQPSKMKNMAIQPARMSHLHVAGVHLVYSHSFNRRHLLVVNLAKAEKQGTVGIGQWLSQRHWLSSHPIVNFGFT